MGNAPSNHANGEDRRLRPRTVSPFRDSKKPPLIKKGSLDLPDISLTVTPLPIPTRKGAAGAKEREVHSFQSYAQPLVPPSSMQDSPPKPYLNLGAGKEGAGGSDTSLPYQKEVVRSALPIVLGLRLSDPGPAELVSVPITWKGTAESVIVSHTLGDEEFQAPLQRDGDNFFTLLHLPPGTHALTFYIDGITQLSNDMPTTVDENSALVNYVIVPAKSSPRSSGFNPKHRNFWASELGEPSPPAKEDKAEPKYRPFDDTVWTSEIPQELVDAAGAEDDYLTAYGNHQSGQVSYTFPRIPDLPGAPPLPRHFGRQILNNPTGLGGPKDKRRGRRSRTNSISKTPDSENPRVLPVTTASGTEIHKIPGLPPTTPTGLNMTSTSETPAPAPIRETLPSPTLDVDVNGVLGDDSSVLPVPSHVVLNHLCTSSIRHGVIAVAQTTRYNKYLTTIYYKPT